MRILGDRGLTCGTPDSVRIDPEPANSRRAAVGTPGAPLARALMRSPAKQVRRGLIPVPTAAVQASTLAAGITTIL
jgi:hypothetical protein